MISNVVGTSNVNTSVDLGHVVQQISVAYKPSRFSGVSIRLERCTLLLFTNGKVVIAGGKSKNDLENAVHELSKMLLKIGYADACAQPVTITNVVSSGDVGFPLRLEELQKHQKGMKVEKEIFPGGSFKMANGATVVVFSSGKFYCTGVRDENESLRTLDEAKARLALFPFNCGEVVDGFGRSKGYIKDGTFNNFISLRLSTSSYHQPVQIQSSMDAFLDSFIPIVEESQHGDGYAKSTTGGHLRLAEKRAHNEGQVSLFCVLYVCTF